jgi:hypothetical protein
LLAFRPVKKISERLWEEKTHGHPEMIWKHKEGAKLLEEAWRRLTRETVQHGWLFLEKHVGDPVPDLARESDDSSDSDGKLV